MATRGLFLLPEGKGVSLSRSIVLDFESADKDEFVSYAEDKQKIDHRSTAFYLVDSESVSIFVIIIL